MIETQATQYAIDYSASPIYTGRLPLKPEKISG
jgi:hypothetical protein